MRKGDMARTCVLSLGPVGADELTTYQLEVGNEEFIHLLTMYEHGPLNLSLAEWCLSWRLSQWKAMRSSPCLVMIYLHDTMPKHNTIDS